MFLFSIKRLKTAVARILRWFFFEKALIALVAAFHPDGEKYLLIILKLKSSPIPGCWTSFSCTMAWLIRHSSWIARSAFFRDVNHDSISLKKWALKELNKEKKKSSFQTYFITLQNIWQVCLDLKVLLSFSFGCIRTKGIGPADFGKPDRARWVTTWFAPSATVTTKKTLNNEKMS